jgi:membrane-associated phospholipid phosphatase
LICCSNRRDLWQWLGRGRRCLATYAIGKIAHSPQIATVGGDLVRAQFLNFTLTSALKVAVDRRRPDGGRYSFPSGHTSATAATATVLQQHFGWRVGVPAFAVAAYVAGQRLQEDAHYLSDVTFGAAIGVVSGRAVAFGHHAENSCWRPQVDGAVWASLGLSCWPER